MLRRTSCVFAIALVGLAIVHCDTATTPPVPILPGLDAATDTPVVQTDAPVTVDAEVDAGPKPTFACQAKEDCGTIATTPDGCALAADCVSGECVYVAKDSDGDGHPMAGCRENVGGTEFPGDDCDDTNSKIFPGAACSEDAKGTPVVFPGGTPQGACKLGAITCTGGKASCAGTVAPQATDLCNTPTDENCDGVVNDGCPCSPIGAKQACGNGTGMCKQGSQTCLDDGKGGSLWGACTGGTLPQPRNCKGAKGEDYDCNGKFDVDEAACLCDGTQAVGAVGACSTGKPGICSAGTRTCGIDPKDSSLASWGTCVQTNAAKAADCNSTLDNDCDGTSDELEAACVGNGCIGVATQKFTTKMWGCPGKIDSANRGSLCDTSIKAVPCSDTEWETYLAKTINAKSATHQYWTSSIAAIDSDKSGCFKSTLRKGSSGVCIDSKLGGATTDPEGNVCNPTACGKASGGANTHYGAIAAPSTAGTLCCVP